MSRYETLFVTVPEITSDESKDLQKKLEKTVTSSQGSVISFDRWGKYHLAYPIKKNEYGVYYLLRFEVEDAHKKELLDNLKSQFKLKLGDLVMRTVSKLLPANGSLEYKRPDSLEEEPSADIDTIMKESKNILRSEEPAAKEGAQEGSQAAEGAEG